MSGQRRFRHLTRVFVACAALLTPCHASAADATRTTEWSMPAAEAWAQPGFRFALQLGYDMLRAANVAPSGRGFSFALEPGLKLTRRLGLSAHLRYSFPSGAALRGQRWQLAAGPNVFVGDGLQLNFYAGYAGASVAWVDPARLINPARGSCDGQGFMLGTLVHYLFYTGEMFGTGPSIFVGTHRVVCSGEEMTRGTPFSLTFWHLNAGAAWSFAWR